MGLEIGYNIWKNKDGKLIKHNLTEEEDDLTWVCGRCDVTYAWEYGCSYDFNTHTSIEAVFNKEFDNYSLDTSDPEYTRILKYVDFNDFKEHVMGIVNEEYEMQSKAIASTAKRIEKLKNQIKEYQELQLKATTDFIFDKFQQKIEDCRDEIEEEQAYLDHDFEEDYDYSHAKAVEAMLDNIDKYLKQGFIISTFFSY